MIQIKSITANETHVVRHPVLRNDKPIESCIFIGDELPTTHHFGLFVNNELTGVISVYENKNSNFEEAKQLQIRGMAVIPEHQNKGFGHLLVLKAEEYALSHQIHLIWFNARKNAVNFYKKNNYTTFGSLFDIKDVGLHFVMFKRI